MDSSKKNAVEKLILLLSRDDVDMDALLKRVKENNISSDERYFLGLILGYLNKIFGAQTTFRREHAALDKGKKLEKKAEEYEKNSSADALKASLQPLFNTLLGKESEARKARLLKKVDAIAMIMDDSYTAANLTFIWQCIQSSEEPKRAKARTILTQYQKHLRREINLAYPYKDGIKIKDSLLCIMTQRQNVVESSKMPKNLNLLVEKYNIINSTLEVLNNPKSSMTELGEYMNKKTRPIIEKERTHTDNAFLNAILKLFTNPLGFFSKSAATYGRKVANKIIQVTLSSSLC